MPSFYPWFPSKNGKWLHANLKKQNNQKIILIFNSNLTFLTIYFFSLCKNKNISAKTAIYNYEYHSNVLTQAKASFT